MSTALPSSPFPSKIREELQALIIGELMGPAGGPDEEVAEDRLNERYVVGILSPCGTQADPPETQDSLAVQGQAPTEEGEPEPETPAVPTIFPSSMGLTFGVDGRATALSVTARWGRYQRQRSRVETAAGEPRMIWQRYAMGGVPSRIELREGTLSPVVAEPEQPKVFVRGQARRARGDWLVTLFLVNEQVEPKRLKEEAWLFQVELAVEGLEGQPIFRRRPAEHVEALPQIDEEELQILDMLFRDHVEFAVGHGVAVHAEPDPADARRAVRIQTRPIPVFDLPRTDSPTSDDVPALRSMVLDMARLSQAKDSELSKLLQPLVDAYDTWIDAQTTRIGRPTENLEGFEDVARGSVERSRLTAQRIREGIVLLGRDPDIAEAFRFANRAMHLQRVRSLAVQDRRRDPSRKIEDLVAEHDVPGNRSWRPFQLAFILLNLPALSDPKHPDRRPDGQGVVDLLWFPTGGGKTEAYLGLVALDFAIRRLQGRVSGYDGRTGVAAIMRYTLRLLTIQQFQRAAVLLCACEAIRRERLRGDPRWGETPFRIGLWVGQRATPNTTDQAAEWLKQAKGTGAFTGGQSGTPAQLPYCPWCGTKIDERRHIEVEPTLRRTLIYCGDEYGHCLFTARQSPNEGLPVVVVDEEIYRLLPALVIGTVDKFAQLPWRGPVQTLFGQVTGHCERHGFRSPDLEDADSHPKKGGFPAAKTVPAGPLRPPDLIIQDELHLIVGPLGTMVGLYETAVDELCAWAADGINVRAKVIASTATVRRAPQQVHSLFWRRLETFPPPVLDARDSFFAVQLPPNDNTPARRYLGICALGREFRNTLIRVYVAAMAAAQALFEKYGEALDPWMTVVGYFNSLKDLGGMRRSVDDDVSSRLARIDRRGLARRQRPFVEELTSRRGSGDIPRVLDLLNAPFRRARGKEDPAPIDVLLATNMISVGIDVPRLGLMVVAGQPKATAEYIQATSRIGRDLRAPGLVLTVYGWARPRDLSHYERFEHYHATFYRHVEALSVTPFAQRARDRGLTALLVSLVRQVQPKWNAEPKAEEVDRHDEFVKRAVRVIVERAQGVAGLPPGATKEVEDALWARLDQWDEHRRVPGRHLAYRDKQDGVTVGLLKGAHAGRWDMWTCLTSLRDVEPSINLVLDSGSPDDGDAPSFEFHEKVPAAQASANAEAASIRTRAEEETPR